MQRDTTGSYWNNRWTCEMCGEGIPFGIYHACETFQDNVGTTSNVPEYTPPPTNIFDGRNQIIQKLDEIIKLLEELTKV